MPKTTNLVSYTPDGGYKSIFGMPIPPCPIDNTFDNVPKCLLDDFNEKAPSCHRMGCCCRGHRVADFIKGKYIA